MKEGEGERHEVMKMKIDGNEKITTQDLKLTDFI